ncbi:MAG: stage V sporulation protein AC [Sarcina sp.]
MKVNYLSKYRKDNKIKKKFDELSKELEPKPKLLKNCFNAFWVGGGICLLAEFIKNGLLKVGIASDNVAILIPIIMIFIGAILTALGIYRKIGNIAGAGTLVPITGFANAMVSPAMEYRKEGYILGVGTKMFTIAGPVLVYGIGSSVILGIIYYILLQIGVVI